MSALGPIRDQRTMVAVHDPAQAHRTPDDVAAAWQDWATRNGLAMRARDGDHTRDLRESPVALMAFVDGGAWYAACPRCNGGIAAWPDHDRGCCLDCGTIYPILYPEAKTIRAAEQVLAVRPPHLRSWFPGNGETVQDLERENREHDLPGGPPSTVEEAQLMAMRAAGVPADRAREAVEMLRVQRLLA